MIQISTEGLFKPLLENGLDPQAYGDLEPELQAAHRELMARRGRDLGFYDLPLRADIVSSIAEEVTRLKSIADDLIVLGIGGSSLGGQALIDSATQHHPYKRSVHFVDNIDADSLGSLIEHLDPQRTAALVITKSGSTVETMAEFLIIRRWFKASLGQGEARTRMCFVTDPEKGFLRELANVEGIRTFDIPANVGGRFSALCPVGLLPAAFAGVDIEGVLDGAKAMLERVTSDDMRQNPACMMAAATTLAGRQLGASSLVMMPYASRLKTATYWFVQLWAESLGKRLSRNGEIVYAGQTPIPALGVTDQHSQLQLFVEGPRDKLVSIVSIDKPQRAMPIPSELEEREELAFLVGRDLDELLQAERRATRAALLDAGVPVLDISLPQLDSYHVGSFMMLLESACAVAGMLMGINPFDQPGVEAGKRMALGLLGKSGYIEDAERVYRRESTVPIT